VHPAGGDGMSDGFQKVETVQKKCGSDTVVESFVHTETARSENSRTV
jgi:hypothetical protein